jgi:aryl-alcohol dehydrogenase-like predicted oxidoreductase
MGGTETMTHSISYRAHEIGRNEATNLSGNARKSLHVSVKDSMRKLRTDYVRFLEKDFAL